MAPFNLYLSGGYVFSSGAAVRGGLVTGSGAATGSMTISSGASVTLGTTMPVNGTLAYYDYITSKRNAMTTGGSGANYNFSGGYLNAVSSHCLMTLNGVKGYPGSGACTLNITPSVGFWTEPTETWNISGAVIPATLFRTLAPCITCQDYNNLFALEMVLYHAINKVDWRLVYNGVPSSPSITVEYPEGAWLQYQALVTAWDFYAAKSAYLTYANSVRESLSITIGWSNPTCDVGSFVCRADITNETPVGSGTADYLRRYLLFYPGNLVTPGGARDNNTYNPGEPVFFMITGASGGLNIFCGPGSANKSALIDILSGISSGGTFNGLTTMISGAVEVNDIQDMTTSGANISGNYTLGLAAPRVQGLEYAAQGFGMGFAANVQDSFNIDASTYDTYKVQMTWWEGPVSSGGSVFGPVSGCAQTLKTYALTQGD